MLDTAIGVLVMLATFAVMVFVAIGAKKMFFWFWKLIDDTAPRNSEEAHRRRQQRLKRSRR